MVYIQLQVLMWWIFYQFKKIYLRTNISFENFNNYDKSSDVLITVQNNAKDLAGVILYNNDTNLKFLINEKDISNFTLRITDFKNIEIDFNNCDWNISFQVDYIMRNIPLKNSLSRFIKNNDFIKNYIQSLEEENLMTE